MVSIKRPILLKHPGLNFSPKVSIKRPSLSQVVRASVHENQGNLDFFEKVYIKQLLLHQVLG